MSKIKAAGTVNGNPVINTIKGGVEVGNLYVDIPDVGRATVFFDDPHDEQLFSFQNGDDVDVEYWKKGEWINANVLTPKGTADSEQQLSNAMKNKSGDGLLDRLAKLIVLCRTAVIHSDIADTIHEEVSPDAVEETIRTSAASLFIEVNRKGIDLDDLLG